MDIKAKRKLLRSVRIAFGPELEVPRNKAIDNIIERSLYGSNMQNMFQIQDIQQNLKSMEIPVIREEDIWPSLSRLIDTGRVAIKIIEKPHDHFMKSTKIFCLTEVSFKEIDSQVEQSDKDMLTVVNRLFKNIITPSNLADIKSFFITFMATVFSNFGESWILNKSGNRAKAEFIKDMNIDFIVNLIIGDYNSLKSYQKDLIRCCTSFFETDDPEYSLTAFNFIQINHILEVLGVKSNIDFLSNDTFHKATMYLDTNCVVASLLPGSADYRTLQELSGIAKKYQISLMVTTETADETNLFELPPRNWTGG